MRSVNVVYTSADKVIIREEDGSNVTVGEKIITSSVPGAYDGMPIKLVATEMADVEQALQAQEEPLAGEEPSANDKPQSDSTEAEAEISELTELIEEDSPKDSQEAVEPQQPEGLNNVIEQETTEEEVVTPQSSAAEEAPTNAAS